MTSAQQDCTVKMCLKMKATLLFLNLCGLSSGLFRKHIYVKENFSWGDAQKYCRQHHDDLSTMTKETQQVVKHPNVTEQFIWIGLHANSANPAEWFWSGGETESVDNWESGEPNLLLLEHCAAVWKKYSTLINYDCLIKTPFFCMEIFELILVQENKTWEEALDYCRQNYIDLVSITSEDIMADVVTNTAMAQTAYAWTGLRFLAGHWFWVSGEKFEYEAWAQEGELQCPSKNLRCAAFDTEQKVWIPEGCEERLNFFCVKRKN